MRLSFLVVSFVAAASISWPPQLHHHPQNGNAVTLVVVALQTTKAFSPSMTMTMRQRILLRRPDRSHRRRGQQQKLFGSMSFTQLHRRSSSQNHIIGRLQAMEMGNDESVNHDNIIADQFASNNDSNVDNKDEKSYTDATTTSGSVVVGTSSSSRNHHNPFSQAYHLYIDYFDRLWSETAVDERKRLAIQRAMDSITRMKNMISGNGLGLRDEYLWTDAPTTTTTSSSSSSSKGEGGPEAGVSSGREDREDDEEVAVFADLDESVRRKMEEACMLILEQLEKKEKMSKTNKTKKMKSINIKGRGEKFVPLGQKSSSLEVPGGLPAAAPSTVSLIESSERSFDETSSSIDKTEMTDTMYNKLQVQSKSISIETTTKKKKGRSVLFGATMGLAVACWVYSGNYIFTTLFTLMTALGQLEYYRMVMNAGIYPARRISVLGACAMFVTALFAPDLHQICLPVASTVAMIWFLTMRRGISTISEIATTFTGIFYLGYIPSYWVRIRLIGGDIVQPTRLQPIVKPILDRLGQNKLPYFLPKTIRFPITAGANFIFSTWLCIAFSDVGGYFAGRKFGKTKLGAISTAAGKTSPNKTVEGVIGGCAFSVILATLGAWIQKWPYWLVHGKCWHNITVLW